MDVRLLWFSSFLSIHPIYPTAFGAPVQHPQRVVRLVTDIVDHRSLFDAKGIPLAVRPKILHKYYLIRHHVVVYSEAKHLGYSVGHTVSVPRMALVVLAVVALFVSVDSCVTHQATYTCGHPISPAHALLVSGEIRGRP
jgi:hypothetical protein